jgi:hypothetical protein
LLFFFSYGQGWPNRNAESLVFCKMIYCENGISHKNSQQVSKSLHYNFLKFIQMFGEMQVHQKHCVFVKQNDASSLSKVNISSKV